LVVKRIEVSNQPRGKAAERTSGCGLQAVTGW
jgi:hypothetical protein